MEFYLHVDQRVECVGGREEGMEVGDPVIRPLIILTPPLRGRPLFGKLCVAQEE